VSTRVLAAIEHARGAAATRKKLGERELKNADEASSSIQCLSLSFLSPYRSPHFLSLPNLHSHLRHREAPGRVQQDQRQVPGPHPGEKRERESGFAFFLANQQAASLARSLALSGQTKNRADFTSLNAVCSLSSRDVDSERDARRLRREEKRRDRAGEEHESPRRCERKALSFRSLLFSFFFDPKNNLVVVIFFFLLVLLLTSKTPSKRTPIFTHQVIVEKADKSDIPDIDKKK